jgi:nucleoside-diphosphate-sugar epimerase
MDTRGDITKARQLLAWEPRWTLESGVTEMLRTGA